MGVSVCVGVNVLTCRRIISGYIFRFTIGFFGRLVHCFGVHAKKP